MKKLIYLSCLFLCTCSTKIHQNKPNIIVIMAEDLGYGDVGVYGAKPENVKTPNIDKLAKYSNYLKDLSKINNFFFKVKPPSPENPPKLPSDLITLWHGIAKTILFCPHILPT